MLKKIAAEERGLVLVTGTTGSGKSTSLAAMIDHINATRTAHVITIEDPIEYLHRDNQCIINQREIGVDTRSFAYALRSALRQDPDVILVGEMRDMETIETAMHAAETGHLVFSTLHTLDATETINRIISVFPPHQQKQIRLQLASVLKAAIAQRLIPRKDGTGRVPGVEVLVATPFIKDCIVDKDKTHLIAGAIAQGTSQYGMQTFDQSIFSLFQQRADQLRRGAALGVERGRVQAQGAGHLDHRRRVARSDGQHDLRQAPNGAPTSAERASRPGRPPPSRPEITPVRSKKDPEITRSGWPITGRDGRRLHRRADPAVARASCRKRSSATRLTRRELDADDIDAAIARLKADRTLDDRRVALRAGADGKRHQAPRPRARPPEDPPGRHRRRHRARRPCTRSSRRSTRTRCSTGRSSGACAGRRRATSTTRAAPASSAAWSAQGFRVSSAISEDASSGSSRLRRIRWRCIPGKFARPS